GPARARPRWPTPSISSGEPGAELLDRCAGPRPGTAEQRAGEQQEMSRAHGAHGAPLASFREGGRDRGICKDGDPLRIAGDDRLERDLSGGRRDVAEDVAGTGLRRQLIQVTAVADDDRRVVPNDKREGRGRWWWRTADQTIQNDRE